VIIDDCMYIFGGKKNDFDHPLSDLHVFDLGTSTWFECKIENSKISPRYGHSCVSYGRHLYVFGGLDSDVVTINVDSFIVKSENTLMSRRRPTARIFHSCSRIGNQMYIFGGINENFVYLGDLWVFDLEKSD
jgi:N-acetylneuraminic acid mutarotase